MTAGGQDDARAVELFEALRWPDGPVCPHCGAGGRSYVLRRADGSSRAGERSGRRVRKCGACRQQFSVLTGTVFHGSRVGAATWLAGLELMTGARSAPGDRLARVLADRCGIDRGTAVHVLSRLRAALAAAGR